VYSFINSSKVAVAMPNVPAFINFDHALSQYTTLVVESVTEVVTRAPSCENRSVNTSLDILNDQVSTITSHVNTLCKVVFSFSI
jgi:hypothetical protein